MAVGDIKADLQAIANGGMLVIQPPTGEEWVIHNLYWSQSVTVRICKGANVIGFDSDSSTGARLGTVFHLTNTQYLQILNNYAGNNNIGYDGVQTK
jgi:hypothetical protein